MEKRPHNLISIRDSQEFESKLAHSNIDLGDLISEFVVNEQKCSVLLVGSIAEGNATPSSDIDLAILVEDRNHLRTDHQQVLLDNEGSYYEALIYRNNIEINIDFYVRDEMSHVMKSMVEAAPIFYDPTTVKTLPMMGTSELQFLHRISKGWSLRNESIQAQWKDEFLVDMLSPYIAIKSYMDGLEYLEDARSFVTSKAGKTEFFVKMSVERFLRSMMAFNGETSQSSKTLISCALNHSSYVSTGIVQSNLTDLLFSQIVESESQRVGICDQLEDIRAKLHKTLSQKKDLKTALDFLAMAVSYVDDNAA